MNIFDSIFEYGSSTDISVVSFLIATGVSLVLGFVIAKAATYKQESSKSFITTLAVLPAIVQMIIMIVNGNVGTGIAVMGTFSLVRFRSLQGNAREIAGVFLAMAVGLTTGAGYVAFAAVFTVIIVIVNIFYLNINLGSKESTKRSLKVVIPEDLYNNNLFDDLFRKYTTGNELVQIKTINMGTFYRLTYNVELNDSNKLKEFIDEIRYRNGNLEVTCGFAESTRPEL